MLRIQVCRQYTFQWGRIAVFGTQVLTSFHILGTHNVSNPDTHKQSGLAQVPKPILLP
jgi:hypothetical protein